MVLHDRLMREQNFSEQNRCIILGEENHTHGDAVELETKIPCNGLVLIF